jgi:Flp pilus assembly protein TadD
MDALKRAEQEKREAARKLEDASPAPRLEPRSGTDPTDQHHIHYEPPPAPRPHELSLEPVSGEFASSPEGGVPAQESAQNLGSEDVTFNAPGEQLLNMQLNVSQPIVTPPKLTPSGLADQIVPEGSEDGDRTFHGFGVDAPAPVVPGMYEETMRGTTETPIESPGYDETLPGVSAAQLAKDIGTRDQPTPVAAETVFVAGRSREESSGLKWILGGLTVVMLCAAGIWYYLTVTPVARNVPSPWVARGIESLPAVRGEAGLPVTDGAEIPGAVPVTDAVPLAPEAAGGPPPETLAATAEAVAPVPGTAAGTPAAVPAVAAAPAAVLPVEQAPAAVATAPAAPSTNATAPSLVRITRETNISAQERMVREAYALYQSGDLAGAQSIYQAVLNDAPDNIDALLGSGAIAMRNGDTAKAVELHGRVLQLDPDNETALAVLVGLNKSVDLNAAESAINSLIKDNPEQAFLQYTLGNIYAAQQRWPESQQAFFEAYRIDSSSPDYALNLAVSLDRIGQRQSALDYYNTALRLAELHPASFDPSAILARIQSLSATP